MIRGTLLFLFRAIRCVTHLTVHALWGRSKRISVLLALLLVLEIACSVVTTTLIAGDAYLNQLCLYKKLPLVFVLFG